MKFLTIFLIALANLSLIIIVCEHFNSVMEKRLKKIFDDMGYDVYFYLGGANEKLEIQTKRGENEYEKERILREKDYKKEQKLEALYKHLGIEYREEQTKEGFFKIKK